MTPMRLSLRQIPAQVDLTRSGRMFVMLPCPEDIAPMSPLGDTRSSSVSMARMGLNAI